MKGWIKLHRRFLEWEWYDDANTLRLFLHCLLKANHKDKSYRGTLIKRSTFVTSLEILAFELNMSVQNIRTSLGKLEKTGEINRQSNRIGTLITVCNYDTYQSEDTESNKPTNKEVTDDQHTINTELTTTKNEKKEKNERSVYLFERFWDDYNRKFHRVKTEEMWEMLSEKDKLLIKEFIPIYKASVSHVKYLRHPHNFLDSKMWLDDWKNYKNKNKQNDTSNDFYQELGELEQLREI